MLFDRPCFIRTPLWFLLIWLLWSDHISPLRWEWRAIILSCPAIALVLCHVMEVSCYHSLLGSYIANIVCTLLLWALWPSLGIHASRYFIKCTECQILFCIDSKVSITTLLKNPFRLSRDVQVQSSWSSRLPQEMQRRSLGQTHTSSWDSISSNNCLSGESVVSIVNSCGRSGLKEEGWWHRFWMHLNPILMV